MRKVVGGFGKNSYLYWCEKARKHICLTNCHDMTLAVKVAVNLNTTKLDFSHLFELKNICINELYMKKQHKSSITKNHKITKKKGFFIVFTSKAT